MSSDFLDDDESPLAPLLACLPRAVFASVGDNIFSAMPDRDNDGRRITPPNEKMSVQQPTGARGFRFRLCRSPESRRVGPTRIERCESELRPLPVDSVAFEQGGAAWLSASSSVVQESL